MPQLQENPPGHPCLSYEGTAKVIYNAFLIFAALAGHDHHLLPAHLQIYDFDVDLLAHHRHLPAGYPVHVQPVGEEGP